MSLFEGLAKCQNEICPNFIKGESLDKYKSDGDIKFCSWDCLHAWQISQLFGQALEKRIERAQLLADISKNLIKFKQQILEDCTNLEKKQEFPEEIKKKQLEDKKDIPSEYINEEIKKRITNPPSVVLEEYQFSSTFINANTQNKIRETIEFAACLLNTKTSAVESTFHTFVKPLRSQLTEQEKTLMGIKQEQIDSGKDFATLISDFDAFLNPLVLSKKKFGIMFFKHSTIAKWFIPEAKEKKVNLKEEYYSKYLNLKGVFIDIYKNNKAMLNKQKIDKKLKNKKIDDILNNLEDMMDFLNMKYKERYINNLDLVDNMIRIIKKLIEKGFIFTNKYLYSSGLDNIPEIEGDKQDNETL